MSQKFTTKSFGLRVISMILVLFAAGVVVASPLSGTVPVALGEQQPPHSMADMTSMPGMDHQQPGAIVKHLSELVKTQNPTAAFTELRKRMAADPDVASQCHALTHIIGDAAYEKYESYKDAVPFNNDLCGSGYLHSLISNVIKGTDDPTLVIGSICEGQDGYCYHGIGHGLMFYTKNGVPRSLLYCATLDTDEHATRCSEGVFMQNFEDEQMYDAPYVYPTDPLKLCREEPRFKSACYIYAGEFLAKDWKTAADLFGRCDRSAPGWSPKCVSGMGAYLLGVNLAEPKKAEAACDIGKTRAIRNACIDGLVSYHLVNYNSVPKTQELCNSLEQENIDGCLRALAVREQYYK